MPLSTTPHAVRIKTSAGWQDLAVAGPPGPPGPPGPGASTYVYVQVSPALTWTILHNLGRSPSVTIVDSGGSVVIPDVHYDSTNQLTVTFGSATSGKAYLN